MGNSFSVLALIFMVAVTYLACDAHYTIIQLAGSQLAVYLPPPPTFHQSSLKLLDGYLKSCAERCSSFGCASAWHADTRGFDPHIWQHSFMEIGHDIISVAILSGQLSVCTDKLPRRLAQEQ